MPLGEHDTELVYSRDDTARASFPLMREMWVEPGTNADWELLHDLHYKAEKLPFGPRYWRLTLRGETIGVIVLGSTKGLLKERHLLLKNYKPDGRDTRLTNKHRYVWANENFGLISRFVTDTLYRGVGIGWRMQNLVSRMTGHRFMEIQSSMSKFNFFAQRAGFRFVQPMNSSKYEAGLKFFRLHFETTPQDFEGLLAELDAMPARLRDKTVEACREFYYRHSALEKTGNNRANGKTRVEGMSAREIIKSLQQLTLASPMYGLYVNPDFGRPIPQRLPLLAADWQGVTEPLRLDLAG